MKGKNFSCNNSEGKRKKSDFYETPYSLTRLFLDKYPIPKLDLILEPACGNGAIVKVLQEKGYVNIESYDKERNFFTDNGVGRYDVIITNPPFSLAYEFIKHAIYLKPYKIIMLLPLSYLHGKKRHDNIYKSKQDLMLKYISVFTRYPMLGEVLQPDGKHNTGMMVYAWFYWEKDYDGLPMVDWLDNNSFIIKKGA